MYSISYMYSTLFKLLTDTEWHLRYAVIEWGNALSQIGSVPSHHLKFYTKADLLLIHHAWSHELIQ